MPKREEKLKKKMSFSVVLANLDFSLQILVICPLNFLGLQPKGKKTEIFCFFSGPMNFELS